MNTAQDLLASDFATLPQIVAAHAADRPSAVAVTDDETADDYATLAQRMEQVAAALQRDGVAKGDVVAVCAASSVEYVEVFLGALASGAAVAPLASSSTPDALAAQLVDSAAAIAFVDTAGANLLKQAAAAPAVRLIALDDSDAGTSLEHWLAGCARPTPVGIGPEDAFNVIYSSGTTGTPKGIVQPHGMRFSHMRRAVYPTDAVTLISTPLYSNTTLVSLIPTLAAGGTVVLMPKFDAGRFLELAERHRATHTMLVPIQYRRILAHADFDRRDLSSFRAKFATSSPFAADLKREVLSRWPGGLVEFYGMTEGGGTCVLVAHEHVDKLHTVGVPLPEHDIRVIDESGRQLPAGSIGEVVGRSPAMMAGYRNLPEKTAAAEWWDPEGQRFIRTGDVGRFDEDGFLVLMGRTKDMIISGGFNIYPPDLEAALEAIPEVGDAAVVGVPCATWGETPVGFVTLREGSATEPDALRDLANERLGRTQRLREVRIVDALPRSPIGKILKRELRDAYVAAAAEDAR